MLYVGGESFLNHERSVRYVNEHPRIPMCFMQLQKSMSVKLSKLRLCIKVF